jgi:hypothetical protein
LSALGNTDPSNLSQELRLDNAPSILLQPGAPSSVWIEAVRLVGD